MNAATLQRLMILQALIQHFAQKTDIFSFSGCDMFANYSWINFCHLPVNNVLFSHVSVHLCQVSVHIFSWIACEELRSDFVTKIEISVFLKAGTKLQLLHLSNM